jgi:biopolymer transport protein ExbD
VPKRSESYGVLHGRRWSVPARNECHAADRHSSGLIIVFMVIVATSKEYVVNTQLPEESKGEQPHQNERTIVIQIIWSPQHQTPLLKINQESVPWDDLEPRLARIFLSRAEKLAYVKGDNDLDFEYVAQALPKPTMPGLRG